LWMGSAFRKVAGEKKHKHQRLRELHTEIKSGIDRYKGRSRKAASMIGLAWL
jgi:hypothetical protein